MSRAGTVIQVPAAEGGRWLPDPRNGQPGWKDRASRRLCLGGRLEPSPGWARALLGISGTG